MKNFTIFFCLIMAMASGNAIAAKRYVSDQLTITVRSGQGSQHKVLKALKTGARMELLEEFPDTGYAHVELEDGLQGFVRLQYLVDKPVALDRLTWLQGKYDKLKEQNNATKEELANLKAEFSKLSRNSAKLDKESKELQQRMSHINQVAAKPILLDKENRQLKEENVTLANEQNLLRQENQILKDRQGRDWFIAGGGVMLLGVLLGIVLPKLGWRKKSSWSGGSL
ncbi:MAG: TIGR04211 family SH3 domain-containing protein [Gammaproteobacteria bacterium]|nr:TIGR04211 family SH3 domain-containing protein [Gammaproteobacteria bacterium]